jgi:hypothetical protein
MAYDVPGMRISLVAQEAMPKRWVAVKIVMGVDNAIEIAQAPEDPIVGILQMDAREGQVSPVMINGITMWEASEVIPAGSPVTVGADGYAVAGSPTDKVGYALTGSLAAGEIIAVVLRLNN